MAVTVKQLRLRTGNVGTDRVRTRGYQAWGDSDLDVIEDALLTGTGTSPPFAGIPAFDDGLPLDDVQIEQEENSNDAWRAEAIYRISTSQTTPSTGDEQVTYSVNPQSINITQSLEPLARYNYTGNHNKATDYKGGINFDKETGRFLGTMKNVPAFSFGVTQYLAIATAQSTAYVNNLMQAAFTTNDAPFRGFAVGEVLYTGASGTQRNDDDYQINHNFIAAPNATGLNLGDIAGIDKGGHVHLWATYREVKDPVSNFVTQQPENAYTERLYDPSDFPTLIGVTA